MHDLVQSLPKVLFVICPVYIGFETGVDLCSICVVLSL